MSLYVGGKKYNVTIAKWRGFWSVTIHGFPGTIVDCGSQKVIGDDGKVTFKFAEADTYTFIAMKGDKTKVLEVELVDGEYFVEKNLYIGVTLLEYLESTGTQYIDTGYYPNSDTSIEYTAMQHRSGPYDFFGASDGDWTVKSLTIGGFSGGCFNYGTSSTVTGYPLELNVKHKYTLNGIGAYIDDVKIKDTSTYLFTSGRITRSLYIFAVNWGQPSEHGYHKCYGVDIYEANELVMSLIPARSDSNVLGMYDTISSTFFTNAGTGEFIAGPVKE